VGALQHFAIATTTLGTSDITINRLDAVRMYPNPAKDILNIELPKDIRILILRLQICQKIFAEKQKTKQK
jgi:aminopeptidase YwaD